MIRKIITDGSFKTAQLLECRYSVGGGMLGGFSSASVRKNPDGSIVLIIQKAETHADRTVTETYDATQEDLDMIRELIISYDMYSASKKAMSPVYALDADTRTITVSFDNGERFSISSTQDLSRKDMEHFNDIVSRLNSLASGDPIVEIEKHQLGLVLDGYHLTYLLEECNAAEQLLEYSGSCMFDRYMDCGQSVILDNDLDVSDLSPITDVTKGSLCYDDKNNRLVFVYEDADGLTELYKIGELDQMWDGSVELLRDMENKQYSLYVIK